MPKEILSFCKKEATKEETDEIIAELEEMKEILENGRKKFDKIH